jgi:hypothetical protein
MDQKALLDVDIEIASLRTQIAEAQSRSKIDLTLLVQKRGKIIQAIADCLNAAPAAESPA